QFETAPPGPRRHRRPVAERRGLGGPSRPPSTSVKLPAMKCAGCGQDNPEGARFCNACGARLDAAPVQAPRAYTPRHLVEKILTSRAARASERKPGPAPLAGRKGSMELPADRDPEDAPHLLDAALERMLEAAHRYEGTSMRSRTASSRC